MIRSPAKRRWRPALFPIPERSFPETRPNPGQNRYLYISTKMCYATNQTCFPGELGSLAIEKAVSYLLLAVSSKESQPQWPLPSTALSVRANPW
jgi:hypothetical protein